MQVEAAGALRRHRMFMPWHGARSGPSRGHFGRCHDGWAPEQGAWLAGELPKPLQIAFTSPKRLKREP